MQIDSTVTKMANGASAIAGYAATSSVQFVAPWLADEKYTIIATDSTTALQTQIGAGNVTGIDPNVCFTYNGKVYVLANSGVYCSGIDLPDIFNDPNASGTGFIDMSDRFNVFSKLVAMASYQGMLTFFSRYTAQIWIVDSDIAKWQQKQVLPNTGTVAKLSVQSLGDLDVLFLSDSGIRSLRVRDSSLNASPTDIGSPIDLLVQAAMLASPGTSPAACAIVDPLGNRYWLYLNGLIYVLSYYPASKIVAWATYEATYAQHQGFTRLSNLTINQPVIGDPTYSWAYVG